MKELEQAIQFINAGNFESAEKVLLQIKQSEPLNFDVIHMLGLVSRALSKFDQVKIYFDLALSMDQKFPQKFSPSIKTMVCF
jgi:Tfp pilus assembly protein PilF